MMDREELKERMARTICKANGEHEKWWKNYTRPAAAVLAAIEEAGYAIVPVEPTEAMMEAGNNAPGIAMWPSMKNVWQAMLEAAKE